MIKFKWEKLHGVNHQYVTLRSAMPVVPSQNVANKISILPCIGLSVSTGCSLVIHACENFPLYVRYTEPKLSCVVF